MPILIIFALIISLVAILFALQNAYSVSVGFLIWRFYGSLALILLLTLAIGILIGLLVTTPTILRRGWLSTRQKKQLTQLEEEYQGQAQDASSQRKKLDLMRSSQMQLFAALGLTESQTGLLTSQSLVPALAYVLDQTKTKADSLGQRSTCLFVMEVEDIPPTDAASSTVVWSVITQRLQHQLSPRSWLHFDGNNRWYCVTLGMTVEAATDYGEFLSTVLDEPLQMIGGSDLSVKFRIGGAIARQPTTLTSQQLMTQAEQMLEKSGLWDRSRFRMVEAGTSA